MASDTPSTPIQPPDDDRALLRQLFAMVQDLGGELRDVRARLTVLETRDAARDTVGKLDKLLLEVAEARNELRELREELSEFKYEMRREMRELKRSYLNLEERVDRLEHRPQE